MNQLSPIPRIVSNYGLQFISNTEHRDFCFFRNLSKMQDEFSVRFLKLLPLFWGVKWNCSCKYDPLIHICGLSITEIPSLSKKGTACSISFLVSPCHYHDTLNETKGVRADFMLPYGISATQLAALFFMGIRCSLLTRSRVPTKLRPRISWLQFWDGWKIKTINKKNKPLFRITH